MSVAYENLIWQENDGLLLLTLNRPQALNALNARTLEELNDAFRRVRERRDIGAVVLTGAGEKAFAAGADIGELAGADAAAGKEASLKGQAVFRGIETLGRPVVAAVNGFALGGGCELALACTLRVASENAKLGLPEVKLGLIPGYGGTQRLARLVGVGRALELVLTGDPIDAAEALRIGLVNRVVPRETLLPEADRLARTIMSRGPLAVAYGIEAVLRGFDLPFDEGQSVEANLFGLACGTRDKDEGCRAFLEKRPAKFEGR